MARYTARRRPPLSQGSAAVILVALAGGIAPLRDLLLWVWRVV